MNKEQYQFRYYTVQKENSAKDQGEHQMKKGEKKKKGKKRKTPFNTFPRKKDGGERTERIGILARRYAQQDKIPKQEIIKPEGKSDKDWRADNPLIF